MIETIAKCPLFNDISQVEIEKIMLETPFKKKSYEAREVIAFQGDKVDKLIIIYKGIARGEMVDFAGKTVVIEELPSPKPLAPAFIFGKSNIFPVNIISQTKSETLQIQKPDFVRMMQHNSKLLTNFMNNISGRAQFLSNKIKFLTFNTIKGKFAFYLLNQQKNEDTVVIELPTSQSKIAELFGVARPSLARAIREMHNEGVIKAEAKTIRILDKKALVELMK